MCECLFVCEQLLVLFSLLNNNNNNNNSNNVNTVVTKCYRVFLWVQCLALSITQYIMLLFTCYTVGNLISG